MSDFVISGLLFLFVGQDFFALCTHKNLVACMFEVRHLNFGLVFPGCPEGGLIDHVANVSSGQPNAT